MTVTVECGATISQREREGKPPPPQLMAGRELAWGGFNQTICTSQSCLHGHSMGSGMHCICFHTTLALTTYTRGFGNCVYCLLVIMSAESHLSAEV